jgi:hypothetical protein
VSIVSPFFSFFFFLLASCGSLQDGQDRGKVE